MFRKLTWGAVEGYAPLSLDTNDPLTNEYAFKQRLLRVTPTPDPKLLSEFSAFVDKFCEKLPVAPTMSFEEWLSTTHYPDWRKDQLR